MLSLDDFHQQLRSGALAGIRHLRLGPGITAFPAALYELADSLEVLDLSGNALQQLPNDLPRLHRLKILFASNNLFTTLPAVLGRMPQLEMVGFKACQITHVPPESLPPQLRWLILTGNQVTHLPDAIGQCTRLQKLMLSCNQLRHVPSSLAQCHNLELLRLASNHLTEVPAAVLQLPRLAWLALAGNPMTQKSERSAHNQKAPAAYLFEDFDLHTALGEGASGHIYRALHRPTQHTVALKIFKAAQTSDGTPESELAAGLAAGQHAQLLTPLAAVTGHPSGQPAMALPLLPADWQPLAGPPSFASCTRDVYADALTLSTHVAAQLIAQITQAVTHLHARGIVHGDLYAHNMLWQAHTGAVMLSDFGAAMPLTGLPPAIAGALKTIELRALAIWHAEIHARTQP